MQKIQAAEDANAMALQLTEASDTLAEWGENFSKPHLFTGFPTLVFSSVLTLVFSSVEAFPTLVFSSVEAAGVSTGGDGR